LSPEATEAGAYGLRLWKAGLEHLGERSVGLDGVLAQQENYRRSGFTAAHTNVRYGASVNVDPPRDSDLIPLADVPFERVLEFDRGVFPAPRAKFLRCWLDPGKRRAFAVRRDGRLAGYGVIRPSRDGFRIGPLFAGDETIADLLFRALAATASGRAPLVIDVPAPNGAGMALGRRYNLEPVFETVRMYRGENPGLPLTRLYGITTLEQG
jgi:hypothetical protein